MLHMASMETVSYTHLYEGIELFLDLDLLAHRPYPLFQEGEVSPEGIMEHLHTCLLYTSRCV